jgi:p-hydroxybenzoate 3-monooxygenase
MSVRESTTVVIVGGGVSGLTTALLLRSAGIDSIILERRDRAYVEERQRAGLVEHRAVQMFEQWGLGHVLHGFPANDFLEVRVDGTSHLLPEALPGMEGANKAVPQQILVKGLMAELLDGEGGRPDAVRFEVTDVALRGLDGDRPLVAYTAADGMAREIECDFVAGCDGDRGVSAARIPAGASTLHTYDYGITWLTVLADAPAPKYALQTTGSRGWAAQFARGRGPGHGRRPDHHDRGVPAA